MIEKIDSFKAKEKFAMESFYPGLADESMKGALTQKINQSAEDFKVVAAKENPTNEDYIQAIKKGLAQFNIEVLDTEDRERICKYYEELMDIVGLESSGGLLNNFMYGFDPMAE